MVDERRKQLLEIVKKEFIGPDPIDWPDYTQQNGEEILFSDPPRTRYIAGILYPQELSEYETSGVNENGMAEVEKLDKKELEEHAESKINDVGDYLEAAEELINRSNAYRQSAISITVGLYHGDSVQIAVSAGRYNTVNITDSATGKMVSRYLRSQICWDNDKQSIELPNPQKRIKSFNISDTNLRFDITFRYSKGDCLIYTFTLENTAVRPASLKDDDCYFQVGFSLQSIKGFCPLPDAQRVNVHDEDYLSNQLLYRNIRNYAIGHGCAADWVEKNGLVNKIQTTILPSYEVKPIVPASIDGVTLEMLKYGPKGDFIQNIHELNLMCDKYEEWIKLRETESIGLNNQYPDKDFRKTAERHISNCKKCLSRMREGIALLEKNEKVRIAFQYMNLAMIMQQLHYNLPLQKWECDENRNYYLLKLASSLPDPYDDNTWYGNKKRYGKWRPFQLAFVLMNLKSMLNNDCDERSIVDLIWFPTGGGKTEAYLGLSAYTIFIRRLMNKEDSGTSILMRYTLRLLTAQQYERASSMICACDLIRKEHENLFGKSRITIGLWVGSATTPNKMSEAVKEYEKLYNGTSDENPFVILKCPWCGAQMGVLQKKNGLRAIVGYHKQVESRGKKSIVFKCSNEDCSFSSDDFPLPLYVVDEAIYESTPTLVLGTVDKFAMLPFLPQAQRLFGYYDGKQLCSPDLIIQDELHLISGPLGSMVGHYETLISELCTKRINDKKLRPKIIASTATISRAKEQCHALYGCSKDKVFQFPPSGLSAGDSFFAKEDAEQNGRLYIGVLASGSSSDATTSIRLFASLLYAAKELAVVSEDKRDPYWTNVGYFNSIRELGQARTWIHADIDQHLDVIYKRRLFDKAHPDKEEYRKLRRYIWRDEELTSRIAGDKVTASLANLSIAYGGKNYKDCSPDEFPIDICLATNMISVGLDVSRLGLMTVAGQPKTTSEYIQATSRVGRNSSDAPGIVFVLYRPGRPRDKSHYEHFREYHSKLYCSVEPTSVTPFSAPVRERALHAIMIGLIRLMNKYNKDDKPMIPSDEIIEHIKKVISERIIDIDSDELKDTMSLFKERISDWKAWHPALWSPKYNKDKSFTDEVPLMFFAGNQPNEAWGKRGFETPTSMRSVDALCEADLMLKEYRKKED